MTFYYSNIQLARNFYPRTHFSFSVLDFCGFVVLTLIQQTTNNYSGILYPNSLFGKLLTYTILALENTGHGHPQGLSQVLFTCV